MTKKKDPTMPIPPKPFRNPYPIAEKDRVFDNQVVPGGPQANSKRVSHDWPIDLFNFLQSIRPGNGTNLTTVMLLLQALQTACKERGIKTSKNRAEFEAFVANCKIVEA